MRMSSCDVAGVLNLQDDCRPETLSLKHMMQTGGRTSINGYWECEDSDDELLLKRAQAFGFKLWGVGFRCFRRLTLELQA